MTIVEQIKKEIADATCPCGQALKQIDNDICAYCERAIEELNQQNNR